MIKINIAPNTLAGELYPRYDTEADLLEVSSRVKKEYPLGIDIDGNMVLDCDHDGMLINFDLLIPKRLWEVSDISRPTSSVAGNIVISKESLLTKSFHLPLRVKTNFKKSEVLIIFSDSLEDVRIFKLSQSCFFFVKANQLMGFYILLK